ncbi:MAG: EAL domain-containing protein [Pseudomonadota bacterium]
MTLKNPLAEVAEQEQQDQMWRGLIGAAYHSTTFAGIASIIAGGLVYSTLSKDPRLTHLSLWYTVLVAIAIVRICTGIYYRFSNGNTLVLGIAWYSVTLITAAAWGGAALIVWPQSPQLQSFLALVLACMAGGSIRTLASMPLAVPLYITICMTPLLWRLSVAYTETSEAMLLLGMFYVVWMSICGIRVFATERDSVMTVVARERAERTVEYQAMYDDLTSLPNRRLFLDRLQVAVNTSRRSADYGALLFIDLDNFKLINDSLGHQAGDELLSSVATRLQLRLRESDTAARLGGDEFAVIIPALGGELDKSLVHAEKIADALREDIARPIVAADHEMQVTASIGIATFPRVDENSLEVLKHADAAMYEAKRAGRNCSRIFNQAMDERTRHRLKTEIAIRGGLDRGEFQTYYQPQVDKKGNVIGLEALARWHRSATEVLEPGSFLSVAEESGLIRGIQQQVFQSVVRDMDRIRTISDDIVVSVNVSASEFYRPGFSDVIRQQLTEAGIDPSKLCIEITESMAMQQLNTVVNVMNDLRDFGIRFAIDDFGTGYSSLVHLKTLPIDTLKIDQSFITNIQDNSTDAEIVKAIIAMTDQIGIRTIAEGVETQSIADYLFENGCFYHQGWVYGKAEPLENLVPVSPSFLPNSTNRDSSSTWVH